MMPPRPQLLRELLRDAGSIRITIDDNNGQLRAERDGGRCAFAMLFTLDGRVSVPRQPDLALRHRT